MSYLLSAQLEEATRAKNAAQALVNQQDNRTNQVAEIHAIPRPKGEGGSKKKGFNIQAVMQLDNTEENEEMYSDIKVSGQVELASHPGLSVQIGAGTDLPFLLFPLLHVLTLVSAPLNATLLL